MNEREEKLKTLSRSHPCFSFQGKPDAARIHLPVCPECNLRCNYCVRSLESGEERPGVSAKVLTPAEAFHVFRKAVKICVNLKVAGIAGPGDALVTDNAFETFRLIKEEFPDIIFCLSTNGLLLEEKADRLVQAGVKAVTVTVNGVKEDIVSQIYGGLYYRGRHYSGTEGAGLLIEKQKAGIKKISASGVIVKTNIVLIPGINDGHIGEIAKTVKGLGADLVNIMPLIPQYKLKNKQAPGCKELDSARKETERFIKVFRHCAHCRADAAGIPGVSEYRGEIYGSVQDDSNFSHG